MLVEVIAKELHKTYRAAFKAFVEGARAAGVTLGDMPNRVSHDHGWLGCDRKEYFRKRAKVIAFNLKSETRLKSKDSLADSQQSKEGSI